MQKLKEFGLAVLAEWNRANVPRLAAAFSFFAILSLAPLLVLSVVVAGQFLGDGDALNRIVREARSQMGEPAAELLRTLASQTKNSSSTVWATLLSLAITFFSASGLFVQLNESLNAIWQVKAEGTLFRNLISQRITAFVATLIFGAALVAWLVLDSWIQIAGKYDAVGWIAPIASFMASWVFLAVVFGATYKVLPLKTSRWSDTWLGAAIAGFGGAIGKYLFALYFSMAGVGSAYGVAGALVIILLYINYSAQIYLLGSVISYVFAHRYGSRRSEPKVEMPPESDKLPAQ